MPVISWTGVTDIESAAKLVGPRLRQLRTNRGLTIRELAERAGVSKNTVLKIEQGEPIAENLLTRICNKLQTILPNLLTAPEEVENAIICVHRNDPAKWHIAFRRMRAPKGIKDFDQVADPGERRRLGSVGFVSGFVHTHDAALPNGRLQAATLDLFGDQEEPGFRHSGEEFIYCMSGVLKLTVADETYMLYPGDSAMFDSSYRHRYESGQPLDSTEVTRALMVWYEGNEQAFSIRPDEECENDPHE